MADFAYLDSMPDAVDSYEETVSGMSGLPAWLWVKPHGDRARGGFTATPAGNTSRR